MLRVNFSAYNTYVTDSLYQWDKNQVLAISGLNMAEAPEIHFTNVTMEGSIVRQSTLDEGVVIVRIPNSLLQTNCNIKAYVGVWEGETFKVVETVEIPIIARTKPKDYTIEADDGEIYSFNRLEKLVNQSVEEMRADTTAQNEEALREVNETCTQTVARLEEIGNEIDGTLDEFRAELNSFKSTTIQIVSFDAESGVLVTQSPDYVAS